MTIVERCDLIPENGLGVVDNDATIPTLSRSSDSTSVVE